MSIDRFYALGISFDPKALCLSSSNHTPSHSNLKSSNNHTPSHSNLNSLKLPTALLLPPHVDHPRVIEDTFSHESIVSHLESLLTTIDDVPPTRQHLDRLPRSPGPTSIPPLPAYCAGTYTQNDDDDSTSMRLSWPYSLHCSNVGINTVPSPLPPTLLFL